MITKTKIIDGYKYEVTQLGFREGRHTLTRLVRLIGPTLANTLRNLDGGLDLSKITDISQLKVSVLATLIEEISESFNDEDLDHLAKVFGDTTMVSVSKDKLDKLVPLDLEHQEIHFKGRYDSFFKWIWFCLEVNYAGFINGLTGLADRVRSRQAAQAGESK